MDDIDKAQAITDLHIERSLANRQTTSVPFSGFCLNCEEPIENARYCCVECREDHTAKQYQNRQRIS